MPRRRAAALAVLVLAAGLAGCGRLIGQPYDNFTAYYNTFYNARQEFGRAEEEVLKAEVPVDRAVYLSVFYEPSGTPTQNAGFQKAVEKGADLLRDHPQSKWVDDALLLIGKAYFYQANYAGAEQKFREVLSLDVGALKDEAYLWLGRTLLAAEQYADATTALREGIDREATAGRWRAAMRLALGEVAVREGDLGAAADQLERGLADVRDDFAAARATFLLGQVYEALGQPEAAAAAYGRVLDFGPRYELAFAAELSRALALGLSGRGEAALGLLNRMRRDDKNIQKLAAVELARARVLAAAGRPEAGRDALTTLLYDRNSTARVGDLRGRVHYRLAEIYREGLRDFVRAAVHYDTAATALRQMPLADERTTAEAIADAPALAETFRNFARVAGQIAEMDSLLYLGGLDDEAFAAAIAEIRAQREREMRAAERELQRQRERQGFGGVSFGDDLGGRPDPATGAAGQPGSEEAGFLGFRNPVRVQEALIAFQGRWGDRPYVPNWRRAAAIGGGTAVEEELAAELENLPGINTPGFEAETFLDVSAVPRDPAARRRMLEARALARYELGNTLFLSMGLPDSAAVWYRRVIEEDPESPVAARAYFAMAEAQLALGNEAEAEDLLRLITERYTDSEFAGRSRERLGLAPAEAVQVDSLRLADEAYNVAYAHWRAGRPAAAFQAMLAVSEAHAATPTAARARLAAAMIYTEWAQGDTTALLAAAPDRFLGAESVPAEPEPSAIPPPSADARAGGEVRGRAQGGFTWVVYSSADEGEAARVAARYREEGYRASVYSSRVEGGVRHRVGIGAFDTRAEAEIARSALPSDAPAESWLLTLDGPRPTPAPTPEELPLVLPEIALDVPATPDSTGAAGEAGAAAVPEEVPWLEALYASVEADFPGTPYAERARLLREAIETLRPEPPVADAAAGDSTAVDPSAEGEGAFSPSSLWGEQPIDQAAGGFTWVVAFSNDEAAAAATLADVVGQGFRAAAYETTTGNRTAYFVVVGQFATEEQAAAAEGSLPALTDFSMAQVTGIDEMGPLRSLDAFGTAPEN